MPVSWRTTSGRSGCAFNRCSPDVNADNGLRSSCTNFANDLGSGVRGAVDGPSGCSAAGSMNGGSRLAMDSCIEGRGKSGDQLVESLFQLGDGRGQAAGLPLLRQFLNFGRGGDRSGGPKICSQTLERMRGPFEPRTIALLMGRL